jgi:hypothetical protein
MAAVVSAQSPIRRTTNIEMLLAQPGFFHQRQVLVAGELVQQADGRLHLTQGESSLPVVSSVNAPDGLSLVRATFWDIGRLNADDPRLTSFDLQKTLRFDPDQGWPRPGQLMALFANSIAPATVPSTPTIRALVLYPNHYREKTVTVTGQYGGRNLLGDLPAAPANSRWDFVLRTTDAAVWVSNLQPRGRDFNLALDARYDTGRWLEVTGIVQQGRGHLWIDGAAGRLALAKPVQDQPIEETTAAAIPAAPPPEVVFSVPIQDELRVEPGTNVRIQFSRDIQPSTFAGRVRAVYVDPEGADREVETPIPLTVQYTAGNRVLQVRFDPPLAPFRVVRVMLGEGILGTDGQPLAPWTLGFTTGG